MLEPTPALRVVHLTSLHPRFDSRVFYNECVQLARHGYEVRLIAPGDEDLEKDGVRVLGMKFEGSRISRIMTAIFGMYSKASAQDAEIYHFHDPELVPLGILLRLRGKRVIMDVHEDQPGAILHSKPAIPRLLRRPLALAFGGFEQVAAAFMSGIVSTTASNAKRFPAHKTRVVENFPDISDAPARRPFDQRGLNIVFSGTLGELQCIPELIAAMAELRDSGYRLRLGGRFVPESLGQQLATLPGWQRVDFLGWQDRTGIYKLLNDARIGLVLYKTPHASAEFSSRKLYEYLAFGIPLVVSPVTGWANIVRKYQCGVVLEDQTAAAISSALKQLIGDPEGLSRMAKNARDAYEKDLNSAVAVRNLLDLYGLVSK